MTTENERPLDTFGLTNYNDTSDRGTLVPPVDLNNVDTNTNERPLDNFNLYNYDESTDRGVLGPNKEDLATQLENNIENGNITPEQLPENSPIQKEAEQLYDSNQNNDEVKDEAVEEFLKQMESEQPSKQEQDEAAYRQQLNDMQLADDINSNIDNYEMLHFTPEEDKPTEFMWAPGSFMRKDIGDEVNVINSYPTSQKRAALELLARIKSGDIDSYEDMLKANPWMDDAMFEAISSIASNDNSGRIPVITKSSLKRNKAKLENFIEKHPEEAAATLTDEAKQEAEQILYDDDKRNDEVNDEAVGEFLNSNLPALNLQDYHKDVALNGERELDTTETDDVDYRVVEDSDYVPPTYTIDDLDRDIEETSQWPVTNAEEAKAKQNKLKKLKARRVAYGGASTSNTNWDYDKSDATGGKVSPRAGIGSIGGAAGHGSMASTSPTKVVDNHNSVASKAPLPHALEDNQGKVVSVNGKATTAPNSNNNGAFRSGSFGLMSKASSNLKSIKSKAPISGGAKHTGSSMTVTNGMPNVNLDDGKQALVERLKQLLAQLTDEEKKELGFSPALNQWDGKSLNRLDGYTLQDLIDKVEEQLGENE